MRMRRIDLRGAGDGAPDDRADYRAVVPRAEFDVEAATHAVQPIIDAVRTRGVDAIRGVLRSSSTAWTATTSPYPAKR